jgi:GNAT superfamily N-acetyltransferase
VDAVLAFTAHHVVAARVDPGLVAARLPPGDLEAPMSAAFLGWLGERLGSQPGSLDVVLAAEGLGGTPPLALRAGVDPERHPRVARALRYRNEPAAWTDADGLGVLVLGRGLAGRREVAFEVDPAARNRGLGRLLITAARHLTPPGEPLFAQVAPGNVASLRVVGRPASAPSAPRSCSTAPAPARASRQIRGPRGACPNGPSPVIIAMVQRYRRSGQFRVPWGAGAAGMGPWRATEPRPTVTGSPRSTTP